MKNSILFLAIILFGYKQGTAQMEVAPASGSAMAAARDGSVPVNLYTGMPSISIPLFNYKNIQGLSTGISLDYFAGGIKVNESPSSAGLGWNLNMGGVITRSIRGTADDRPGTGYLFAAAIPSDSRSKAAAYYRGCEDSEQDIFQFNFNGRSGNFVIGKNKQVLVMPGSKIRISYAPDQDTLIGIGDTLISVINSFTVTTEDGVRYIFDNVEYQFSDATMCTGGTPTSTKRFKYATAWYLSKIVAPFSTSVISIKYEKKNHEDWQSWNQTDTLRSSTHYHSDTSYSGSKNTLQSTTIINKVPTEIIFPDSSKISLVYSYPGQFRFLTYPVLQRIKYSDSVFRYGYQLNWDTTAVGGMKKDFLSGINYYTKDRIMPGYRFSYNTPYFPISRYEDNTHFLNKKDHWGFYNGANNSKDHVPTISGIYTGADRTPNSLAVASTLSSVKDPSGGTTYYHFENNDVLPTVHTKQSLNINITGNTQTNITLSRLQSPFCNFTVLFNGNTTGSAPVSGSGNMVFSITSTDGTITYGAATVSMFDLFYTRSVSFGFNVPSGSFLLKTTLTGGTSLSATMPVIVTWNNQAAGVGNYSLAGGIRIKQVTHYDSLLNKIDTISTYRYVMADGKSSGFGGTAPLYHYTRYVGMPAVAETIIMSDPVSLFSYTDANYVAYKRVEEIKGTPYRNLGKIVHEFTGADEGFVNTDPASYPYMPVTNNSWSAGLPKRTSVYDSSGRLAQVTANSFKIDTLAITNSNFLSLKYVDHHVSYENYMGQRRFPFTGRTELVKTIDTLYHPDNSFTTSQQQMEYDTNYNLVKTITDYDKTRGLTLEKRFYYPYHYTVTGIVGMLRDSSVFAPISTENWITGDGNPRLLSVGITDYAYSKFFGSYMRPSKTYALESNKPVPLGTIGAFDPSVLVRNTTYIKQQTEIAFDRTGYPIQETDVPSGSNNASLWGYNNRYITAKISNAKSSDVAYTSFEGKETGNWTLPAYSPDSNTAITGRFSYPYNPTPVSKGSLNSSMTYTLSCWVTNGSSVYCTAGTLVNTDQQNGWTFYTLNFTGVTSFDLYVGGGNIDELRLHPKDAAMVSSTFNGMGQVTSVCDANNTIVYSEYDAVNRPLATRDKDRNIIKKFEYPANVISYDGTPNWQLDSTSYYNPGIYRMCEVDSLYNNTGKVLLKETDINYYSETYASYRHIIVEKTDYVMCPLPVANCGSDPAKKSINGVCETGCKVYTSSVHRRIYDPVTDEFIDRWDCTFHYKWSDNSISGDYLEYHSSACSVGPCVSEL